MKRFNKDGKVVREPNQNEYDKYEDYHKALTPQQMAEKIKELERENLAQKAMINLLNSGACEMDLELKNSQQEVERLREGILHALQTLEGVRTSGCNAATQLGKLLETKQKQEG